MDILYFSAPWCGPCIKYRPLLESVASDYAINLIKVNIDDEMTLAYKNKIREIPALVKKDDPSFAKLVGAASEEELRSWLERATHVS
jgi:thioredoxin 1